MWVLENRLLSLQERYTFLSAEPFFQSWMKRNQMKIIKIRVAYEIETWYRVKGLNLVTKTRCRTQNVDLSACLFLNTWKNDTKNHFHIKTVALLGLSRTGMWPQNGEDDCTWGSPNTLRQEAFYIFQCYDIQHYGPATFFHSASGFSLC